MYSAAAKKGGAGGVSQSVAKEFVSSDSPGKLPERADKRKPKQWRTKEAQAEKPARSKALYGKKD